MSKEASGKDDKSRVQTPEKTWFCFAIQRSEGSYQDPGGWVLRCGEVPEGRLPPLDQTHERNLFGVVLARISSIATWFRDVGR